VIQHTSRAAIALALAAALSPSPVAAQRLQPYGMMRPAPQDMSSALPAQGRAPEHPFIDRMNYYMDRGAIAGALLGVIYGAATEPESDKRVASALLDGLVGTGLGMGAGAIVGLAAKSRPRRQLRPQEAIGLAGNLEDASRYAGLGGRLGASAGLIYSLARSHGDVDLGTLLDTGLGWVAGMAVGGITYIAQRGGAPGQPGPLR
jgi:hypothetical protein